MYGALRENPSPGYTEGVRRCLPEDKVGLGAVLWSTPTADPALCSRQRCLQTHWKQFWEAPPQDQEYLPHVRFRLLYM